MLGPEHEPAIVGSPQNASGEDEDACRRGRYHGGQFAERGARAKA